VQAHTLGKVGNLGTVSLRVSSGTILPIFIEIGSYLTDKEQKISWHSFFETRCIWYAKPAPKTGARKWSRFMAPVSGACVMGISLYVAIKASLVLASCNGQYCVGHRGSHEL